MRLTEQQKFEKSLERDAIILEKQRPVWKKGCLNSKDSFIITGRDPCAKLLLYWSEVTKNPKRDLMQIKAVLMGR